jgi:type I restriction enzyme S subunit
MEKVKLGELTDIKTGRLDVNAENPQGKYPFFTCSKNHTYIDNYAFEGESILVAGNGDLNVKYYNGKFNAYQRTYVIQPLKTLSGKYLYYFLDSYVDKLREQSIGGVIKYIKIGNLTEAEIPLPNLPTQLKIANILDKADELRQYNQQLIEKYEALTQSLFLDMFGDPVRNEKGWNLTKFSNVLTKIESGWSPVCENYSRRDENEWAVLKLGAVSYGTYNLKENKKYEFDIPNSKIDCEVKQGDLLFTRKNTYHMVGKTAFVYETESRLLLPDTVFRLVYNIEKVNPLFLYYLLNSQ